MSVKDHCVASPCSNQQDTDLLKKRKTGSFSRANRLLTAKQFSRVFENPYKRHHAYLLILVRKNSEPDNRQPARLGLAVAKKNIKLAVRRNRFKRIIRESFRQHKVQLAGLDIVVLARHAADGATSQQIRTVLEQQWQHLAKQFNTPS